MDEGGARVPFVRMVRMPFEESLHFELLVAASNGRQRGEVVMPATHGP